MRNLSIEDTRSSSTIKPIGVRSSAAAGVDVLEVTVPAKQGRRRRGAKVADVLTEGIFG